MKILLVGELSNIHNTLAEALRGQGHKVVVMSHGDGWKGYPRDIDVSWDGVTARSYYLLFVKLFFLATIKLRGYDVVQFVNPTFVWISRPFSLWFVKQLRKHNRFLVFGCMGSDFLTERRSVETCCDSSGVLRGKWIQYNPSFAAGRYINREYSDSYRAMKDKQENLWRYMVEVCDCLIASVYDVYKYYDSEEFRERLFFVNLPIKRKESTPHKFDRKSAVKVLIGCQEKRFAIKGTDIMISWFDRLARKYPDKIDLKVVWNIPFDDYARLLAESDIVVDQLYSICPAMNALETMSYGVIAVSGGEPEFYDFLGEKNLRPIINLRPFEDENNIKIIEDLILNPEKLERKSKESIEFIDRYFDSEKVALQFTEIWRKFL